MNTDYLYKIYRNSRITQYQRVQDGNFEGFSHSNFLTKWQSVGSPNQLFRSRRDAYGSDAKLYSITLNGLTDYLALPDVGITGTKTPSVIYSTAFSIGFWFNKANWNSATPQTIVDHIDTIVFSNNGFELDMDGTNLRARVNLNGTIQSASYALSSITAGKHLIIFGSDGRYIRLFIDGVNVATYDAGSVVGIRDAGYANLRIGAKLNNTEYTQGTIEQIGFWDKLVTAAEALQMYNSDLLLGDANAKFIMPFVEGSGSIAMSEEGSTYSVGASLIGSPTWAESTVNYYKAIKIVTNPLGSTDQGLEQTSGYKIPITGGNTYVAHCKVKGHLTNTCHFKITVTPTGGGSASSAIVETGTGDPDRWYDLVLVYTSNVAATHLTIKVTMEKNAVQEEIGYIDQIALNDGSTAYPYFDQDTEGSGSTLYSYDLVTNSHQKISTVSEYVATWRNVISDFKYDYEINSAGSQLTVSLPRSATNTGEGTDIVFNDEVRVYKLDEANPNGKQVFSGYIANYNVNELEDKIDVQVIGTGAELNNYLVLTGSKQIGIQPIQSTDLDFGVWGNWYTNKFRPTQNIELEKFVLKMRTTSGTPLVTLNIYKGDPDLDSLTVISGFATIIIGAGNSLVASSSMKTIDNTVNQNIDFTFENVKLYANTDYYIAFENSFTGLRIVGSAGTDTGAVSSPFGRAYIAKGIINNSGFDCDLTTAMAQFYMEIWDKNGSTTATYNSVDPSDILKDILNDYQSQGGLLTYDDSSIQQTNTVVSYPFKSVSTYDAMKKCLELAPAGWFFYIDQAEKKIYFKKQSDTPDHKFVIGKHFSKLNYEKRTDDIVNVIYFTGGDLGGYNFFKKYEHTASIELYGRRTLNYSDNRVKVTATADLIANTILERKSYPQIKIPFDVLKNYDIDSVKPGDVITFRNHNGVPQELSLWDVGYWDDMYWDFDIKNPSTYEMQIVKFGRDGDLLTATLSTLPPDVNKRIEDINRNLEKQQTINNPDEPTVE